MKGYKYLLIVTVILFALVFLLTRLIGGKKIDDKPQTTASETTVSASGTDGTADSTAVTTSQTEAEEEDADIDNKWAMFLVNSKNPLPADYDSEIKTTLVYTSWREYYMDSRMADYMIRMIDDAKADGITLDVVSAYRTFQYQQQNFDNSVQDRMDRGMTYDEAYADAAKEVAMPGESEHNAGLSADIMSDEYSSMDDDGFKNTAAYEWLSEHAADYGFILRYPEGKGDYTGIIYEPWHYRFVGVYYANEIKSSGLCLEEYYESRGWLDESGKAINMLGPVEAETEAPVTAAVTEEKPSQSVTIIV